MVKTGKRIRFLLTENGITVNETKDYLCCSSQAVYKWLNGVGLPSVDNLIALSILFAVPTEEILVVDCLQPLVHKEKTEFMEGGKSER